MTEDERTDGGKWKIEQCSVGPETAINIDNLTHYKKMADISTFYNSPNFATNRLALWKELTSFTIQDF